MLRKGNDIDTHWRKWTLKGVIAVLLKTADDPPPHLQFFSKHKISELRRPTIKSQSVLESSRAVLSRKTMEKIRHPKWTFFFIRRQCSIASKIPNPKVAQQKHKISEFRRARIKSQIVLDSSGDVLSRKNMEKSRHPKWTSFSLQNSVAFHHNPRSKCSNLQDLSRLLLKSLCRNDSGHSYRILQLPRAFLCFPEAF